VVRGWRDRGREGDVGYVWIYDTLLALAFSESLGLRMGFELEELKVAHCIAKGEFSILEGFLSSTHQYTWS
jgi:hypothetical protein